MALRGTLTHWKTRLLADQLGISPAHALGLLEALWHVTAEDAPSGNIGRLSNKAIVMQMFTDFDPDRLIGAFIASGHLDVHPVHRLLIHDWHVHADYNTKRKVERRGEAMHTARGDVAPVTKRDASSRVITQHESIPEPEPEPEPEPLNPSANSSEKTEINGGLSFSSSTDKPSKSKSPRKRKSAKPKRENPPDPRHTPIRKAWERHFEEQVKSPPPKWNGYEAKALSRFLDDNQKLKVEDFETILANRARSPGITQAVRLSSWINRTALCWLHGPANDFGRPITGDQATRKPVQKISEIDHKAGVVLDPSTQSVGRFR